MNAAAVGISITAVAALLTFIAVRGLAHFWPAEIAAIDYTSNAGEHSLVLGEIVESESLSIEQYRDASANRSALPEHVIEVERLLIKTGNRRFDPPDFEWLYSHQINKIEYPRDAIVFERMEWGNAYGFLLDISVDDAGGNSTGSANESDTWDTFNERLGEVEALREKIEKIERGEFNAINYGLERIRLERRKLALNTKISEPRRAQTLSHLTQEAGIFEQRYQLAESGLRELIKQQGRISITIELSNGAEVEINLADVVRAWRPNQMTLLEKLSHYASSLWLFLSEDPREANTEGGIYPAIFGTVLMVLLMTVLVTPFGVIAAVYLREYAHQGPFVRLIRIAINNLAGVPSIVYGVFGLGFFVYFIGGNIDQLFFAEALPAPTFGTPGLMWASLTLALLTVPVVVVSTEEGLTRIPRSIREGSLALGATKAETLFKVVLPIASPSILTGVILAVARAAGEVAPLMLVGVVKLAPTLPMDGNFPFLHLERKFMHLGFHIYDVGFQSPNVEAARPLVYATALILVLIIVVLNLTAIMLRSRLEDRYRGVEG